MFNAYCTICQKDLYTHYLYTQDDTQEISLYLNSICPEGADLAFGHIAFLVKIKPYPTTLENDVSRYSYKSNQQVTNRTQCIVSTSETTRATTSFNSWLAGIIDGDGTFLVSKQGYVSCEITMGLEDHLALSQIQDKIGGSIKPRSGVKAIRWRLHNKAGMIKQVNQVNGHIRHSGRLKQQHNICTVLGIEPLQSFTQTKNSNWFAGFFDADGTITFSQKDSYPQQTISVTNKLLIDIEHYKHIFGGNIYYDKSQNGYYKWSVQSKKDVIEITSFQLTAPCRSFKLHRLHMVNRYYELVDLKAYKAPKDSVLNKAWDIFVNKWNKGR